MEFTYYASSDPKQQPFAGEINEGIDLVPQLLKRLEGKGHTLTLTDTSTLNDENRIKSYVRATMPAVYKHYEVKRMFGTNRHSACFFGAQVPALLVVDGDSVGDTYPHRKGKAVKTIHSFLMDLLATT
jgi:hypothetical protein